MDLNDAGKFLEAVEKRNEHGSPLSYGVLCRDILPLLVLAKAGLELATDLGRVAVHAEDAQTRSVARGLNLKFVAALISTESGKGTAAFRTPTPPENKP